MLRSPLAAGAGHILKGSLRFEANESRGYNVHMVRLPLPAGALTCVPDGSYTCIRCTHVLEPSPDGDGAWQTVINMNTGVEHTNVIVTQCALHHFQYATPSQPSANWNWNAQPAGVVPAEPLGSSSDDGTAEIAQDMSMGIERPASTV